MRRRVTVVGPAYLDRVARVDRPLIDPAIGPPLDGSVDGRLAGGAAPALTLVDPLGGSIVVAPPDGWPGPVGTVELARPLVEGRGDWRREVRGVDWRDDLGGMGAGFAAALGGRLLGALGPPEDPRSRQIADLLEAAGIDHRPIRIAGREADWTLLITSAEFGDKLPIGFRGCHSALTEGDVRDEEACDLRVVAALPNPLAAAALRAPGAAVRFFAPAARNMLDRTFPLACFADAIDALSCNRREWESLPDRDAVADRLALLAVTDGPRGASVHYRSADGSTRLLRGPAFPRSRPPRDTNRAGEAFAATLLGSLLDAGWTPGHADPEMIHDAFRRASAASALVLDLTGFGFPTDEEIDRASRAGIVS
ncbi:MAG TPA: PfkB family carbohydrate kinase [Isosphaeraceae bacterium]|jgi:ribokinase|nr:PfkB family carbohydrate kinase [Isosphaeraceae bacterium]